jgi:hypothetical protein
MTTNCPNCGDSRVKVIETRQQLDTLLADLDEREQA